MSTKREAQEEVERKVRKNKVMRGAITLFAEKGIQDVSMDDIATMTEYSMETLCDLFVNMNTLIEELTKSTKVHIRDNLTDILHAPVDAASRLRYFIRNLPCLLAEYASFVKVHYGAVGNEGCKWGVSGDDGFVAILCGIIAENIATGISQGLFRRVDSLIAAKALWTLIESLAFEMAGRYDKEVAVDKFDKVEQLFVDGLLAA